MRGVGLTYRGRPVALDPDFGIDWEYVDDLVDFERISNGFSYEISIPRAGNEHIFYHIGDPGNTRKFKTIEGFAITVDGNLAWTVNFVLERISKDGKHYLGTLSTIDQGVVENKDRSIREILEEVTWTYPSGGYATVYAHFNGTTNRGIRFPWMHFYNETNFVYPTASVVHIINSDQFAVPCFHMDHILKKLMAQVGYEVIFNLTSPINQNLLIYTPTQIRIGINETTLSYGSFMPDISLADFIREVEFYTGGKLYVNVKEKKIIVESHQFTRQRTPEDYTQKGIDTIVPGKFPYQNIAARVAYENDYLLAENPTTLEGNYLGEFRDAQTLSIEAGTAEDDYGFCLAENAYFKFVTVNNNLELEYYSHPFLERKTGTEENYTFESQLSPCIKDRYYFGEFDVDADLVEGPGTPVSGRCVIQGFEDQSIVTEYDSIGILEFKEREKQAVKSVTRITNNSNLQEAKKQFEPDTIPINRTSFKGKYLTKGVPSSTGKKITGDYYIGYRKAKLYNTYSTSTGAAPDDNKMHFQMEYNGDKEVSKILVAKQLPYYIPIIGKKINRGENAFLIKATNDADLSGGILTWHGTQYQFNKVDTYPFASCDNYYFNTTDGASELDAMSLNFRIGTNNLWTQIFNPLYLLFRALKPLQITAYLTDVQVSRLVKNKVGRYLNGLFIFRRIRVSYDKNGQSKQDIEAYGL